MLTDELDYVVGVDTHRDEHALVVVAAATGARLAGRVVRASPIGYRQALAFADRFADGPRVWAVEGVGSYGAGLTRMLVGCGESVLEAAGRRGRSGAQPARTTSSTRCSPAVRC
jgi:transposase